MAKRLLIFCLETLDTLNEKKSGKICNVLSVSFVRIIITGPMWRFVHVEQFCLAIIATVSAFTAF